MSNRNNNIVLSIGIMTFNHGAFISKFLISIFNQKVNFNYEVVVVDDASTDNTTNILKEFKNDYPDKIKLFLNENNMGVIHNAILLSENCKGKYLSFMDGDDYWIYVDKLQEQVDFLESHNDYTGCFHDAQIISTNPSNTDSKLYEKQHFNEHSSYSSLNRYYTDFLPKYLINRNIIPTASLIFRQIDLTKFLNDFNDIKLSLNWAVHLFIIKGSKFRYIDKQWSAYNDHPDGVSKKYKYSEFINTNIKVLNRFKSIKEFKKLRSELYRSLSREYKFLYHCTKQQRFPFMAILNYIRCYSIFCLYKLFGI